ncbi:hypothetical protein LJC13_02425 [Peptostreptococcaceae bacterium OttesenSCG-928-C18]|nr:hypothetical protein [Peptostreptococcaceae bacterium OttesenSCG-928-C18]
MNKLKKSYAIVFLIILILFVTWITFLYINKNKFNLTVSNNTNQTSDTNLKVISHTDESDVILYSSNIIKGGEININNKKLTNAKENHAIIIKVGNAKESFYFSSTTLSVKLNLSIENNSNSTYVKGSFTSTNFLGISTEYKIKDTKLK